MKSKFKTKFVILLLLSLFIISNNYCSDSENTNTKETPYYLGIGYFDLNPILSLDNAVDSIKNIAHGLFIQKHWQEIQNNDNKAIVDALYDVVTIGRNNNLDIYIALEFLSADRKELELPSGLSGDFTDEMIQNEYIKVVKDIASNYNPKYFILNVEIDMYKNYNLSSYEAYKDVFSRAYDEIKAINKEINIAVSLTLQDFNNLQCIDEDDINYLVDRANDFPKQDMIGISIYPSCFFVPNSIPDNFLNDIASKFNKALFITETGWISKSVDVTDSFTLTSDEKTQSDYIIKLEQMANYIIEHGNNIMAINYISLIDPSEEVCNSIVADYPQFYWYCILSLIDKDGNYKSAYNSFKEWKNRL